MSIFFDAEKIAFVVKQNAIQMQDPILNVDLVITKTFLINLIYFGFCLQSNQQLKTNKKTNLDYANNEGFSTSRQLLD